MRNARQYLWLRTDSIDLASELCDSSVSSLHLLTSDQVIKIKDILELDDDIDMIMTFANKRERDDDKSN